MDLLSKITQWSQKIGSLCGSSLLNCPHHGFMSPAPQQDPAGVSIGGTGQPIRPKFIPIPPSPSIESDLMIY